MQVFSFLSDENEDDFNPDTGEVMLLSLIHICMIVSLIGIICARVFKPLSADETNDRLIAIIEEDFPAVKPVSYTHLDVYKRQRV